MEIVLNFDRKELVIKQSANIKELYKRLKALLGKDLEEWTVVGTGVTWYYPIQPTYPWPTVVYTDGGTTCIDGNIPITNIYCLSDQVETTAELKIEGKDLVEILNRTEKTDVL